MANGLGHCRFGHWPSGDGGCGVAALREVGTHRRPSAPGLSISRFIDVKALYAIENLTVLFYPMALIWRCGKHPRRDPIFNKIGHVRDHTSPLDVGVHSTNQQEFSQNIAHQNFEK